MVHDLMPVSTEAPRCSEFARAIDLLPPGTGLFLSRVLLVTVPMPWPKPALKHELIQAAAATVVASPVAGRLFAAEPTGPSTPQTQAAQTMIEVYERRGSETALHRWHVSTADAVTELIGAVCAAEVGALDSVETAGAVRDVVTAVPPTFLVCTQGSHDTCCGTSGVALADQIEAERSDYVVRRVSHTGGHRFSPTLLAFPEGRMWAFADLALVDRIAAGTTTAADTTRNGRGWWGAAVGPAQVAELAVRAELAGEPFREPHIEPIDPSQGRSATSFVVTVHDDSWQVDVQVGREVPSIACEAPGGLPAKPGREFSWTIKRR